MSGSRCRRVAAIALAWLVLGANAVVAQKASYEGFLTVMWGDPRPGALGGAMRFELTEQNGASHQLEIAPAQQNAATAYFNKRVRVQGRASTDRRTGAAVISVDSIEPLEAAQDELAKVKTVRKVLFLLLKFKGDSQTPHLPSFYTNELTNPKTPPSGSNNPATINGFFNKVSYGKLQWKGDVGGVGGLDPTKWFTLPGTKTAYANCGWSSSCANLIKLRTDALNLATNAGIDWASYDNINFVVNNDLDCCAWGGSFSNGMKTFGATYEPPWGQEAGVYVHEMGHSLGLPHSGWRYYAYDSHHDQMSRGNPAKTTKCGTYTSVNSGNAMANLFCNEPGAGYIMVHQDHLGWIPDTNKAVHDMVGTQTYTIEANSRPMGSALKLVTICIFGETCSGAAAHFLTLEVKKTVGAFDNGLPSEGLVIHDVKMNRGPISGACFFNDQSGWALPIDATPGDFSNSTCQPKDQPNSGLMNMPFKVGKKYKGFNIIVEVLNEDANTMMVKVTKSK